MCFRRSCCSPTSISLRLRSTSSGGKDGDRTTSDITDIAAASFAAGAATSTELPSLLADADSEAPSDSISRAMPIPSRDCVPSSIMAAVNWASPGRSTGSASPPHRDTSEATASGRPCDSTR